MNIRIQLKRNKKEKNYSVIVTSKNTLKGRVIETLGYYNPEGNWSYLKINMKRFLYWLSNGADCSKRIIKILFINK